jgi:hypothetical protein
MTRKRTIISPEASSERSISRPSFIFEVITHVRSTFTLKPAKNQYTYFSNRSPRELFGRPKFDPVQPP